MNVVLIIPTGIGCEIGGHAGDANPVAKLLGACCDKLILHPNVVNASDINEMPPNALYVEGSMLDRFLEGIIQLVEVKRNKILVAANDPVLPSTVNAVAAARATIGIEAEIIQLKVPMEMKATKGEQGVACGIVSGCEQLVEQVKQHQFDALAIHSPIDCEEGVAKHYIEHGGVNPWGGVEAIASRIIAEALNKPVAHAPIEEEEELNKEIFHSKVDPRMAPEVISNCHLHSVLKGLHKAPRIGKGLSVEDVDVLISPYGCYGRPHRACQDAKIPMVIVKENTCVPKVYHVNGAIYVDNYIEAAGLVMAMRAGIHKESVCRPLRDTEIL